jgi:hypothetical protein
MVPIRRATAHLPRAYLPAVEKPVMTKISNNERSSAPRPQSALTDEP